MKKEHLAHWTSHEICSRPKRKSDYLSHDAQVSLSFCSFVQISYKIPVSWIRSKTWYSKTCQQPYYWISNVRTAFYNSVRWLVRNVASSFYATFGVITSNNALQIDCLIAKADITTDKDTFRHTLFSLSKPQSGPGIRERQYPSPILN